MVLWFPNSFPLPPSIPPSLPPFLHTSLSLVHPPPPSSYSTDSHLQLRELAMDALACPRCKGPLCENGNGNGTSICFQCHSTTSQKDMKKLIDVGVLNPGVCVNVSVSVCRLVRKQENFSLMLLRILQLVKSYLRCAVCKSSFPTKFFSASPFSVTRIQALLHCHSLQLSCIHLCNMELARTHDALARLYATQGDFSPAQHLVTHTHTQRQLCFSHQTLRAKLCECVHCFWRRFHRRCSRATQTGPTTLQQVTSPPSLPPLLPSSLPPSLAFSNRYRDAATVAGKALEVYQIHCHSTATDGDSTSDECAELKEMIRIATAAEAQRAGTC